MHAPSVASRSDQRRPQTAPRTRQSQHQHQHRYPPLPTFSRQHHSYYEERDPLASPPVHRHPPVKEEPVHEYHGRFALPSTSGAPYSHGYHHGPPPPTLLQSLPSQPYSQPSHPPPLHDDGHHPFAYPYPPGPSHVHPHSPHHGPLSHHASFSPSSSSSSPAHGLRASMASLVAPSDSTQQPTYRGHIKTTRDAILLLAACDLPDEAGDSAIPPPRRVTRRLLDSERAELICSGSMFVWDEKEAGMRRWTDGKCWSASRVSGCFLTYRELEARKKPSSSLTGGPTSNLYKIDGLIKQSFSMTTTSGRKLHAISYYIKRDVRDGLLRRISQDPRFVGEAGGEWNLAVDEQEFPDPIHRAGELANGMGQDSGSLSPPASPRIDPLASSPSLKALDENVPLYKLERDCEHDRDLDRFESKSSPPEPPPSLRVARRRAISPIVYPLSPPDVKFGLPVWSESVPPPKEVLASLKEYSEPRPRFLYPHDGTPFHEVKSLLPIRPIPVHINPSEPCYGPSSRLLNATSRATSLLSSPTHEEEKSSSISHTTAHYTWPKVSLKRSFADSYCQDSERPRPQRMRSSSMGNSGCEDGYVPLRLLGRAGSDDDLKPKSLSTRARLPPLTRHDLRRYNSNGDGGSGSGVGGQHDSAVGALLSLRSSNSDESIRSIPSVGSMLVNSTTAITGAVDSMDSSATKPSLSRSDRAALDRFNIKI